MSSSNVHKMDLKAPPESPSNDSSVVSGDRRDACDWSPSGSIGTNNDEETSEVPMKQKELCKFKLWYDQTHPNAYPPVDTGSTSATVTLTKEKFGEFLTWYRRLLTDEPFQDFEHQSKEGEEKSTATLTGGEANYESVNDKVDHTVDLASQLERCRQENAELKQHLR